MAYVFGWKCYQKSKTGLKYGTMNALCDSVALGGTDVTNHSWGTPFYVAFDTLEDATLVRALVEEHFETMIHETSEPWQVAAA